MTGTPGGRRPVTVCRPPPGRPLLPRAPAGGCAGPPAVWGSLTPSRELAQGSLSRSVTTGPSPTRRRVDRSGSRAAGLMSRVLPCADTPGRATRPLAQGAAPPDRTGSAPVSCRLRSSVTTQTRVPSQQAPVSQDSASPSVWTFRGAPFPLQGAQAQPRRSGRLELPDSRGGTGRGWKGQGGCPWVPGEHLTPPPLMMGRGQGGARWTGARAERHLLGPPGHLEAEAGSCP